MQRGRLLILFGLLLLGGTGIIAVLLLLNGGLGGGITGTPTPEGPTPVPQDVTMIVRATQNLPRGTAITENAVGLVPWPSANLPEGAIQSEDGTVPKSIIGKLARVDLKAGEPILSSLVADDPSQLTDIGSEAALRIPKGQVAITIPMTRLAGVGYALQEGDHVNVLASLLFVDIAEDTQSALPGNASLFTNITTSTGQTGGTSVTFDLKPVGAEGTVEVTEGGAGISIPFFLQPSEPQRPRLVVQQIVQDAIVLGVGNFNKEKFAAAAAASPTPLPEGSPPPPPTPVPPPDIITLIVPPQDSLVLNYFMYANARLTLALRSAGDTSRVDTESVTLNYAVERFRISVPTPLNFALEPAVRNLHQPILQNETAPTLIPLPDGKYICAGANCP